MGMFDSTRDYERFEDKFKIGDVFTVRELRVGPTLNTDYGENTTFVVNVDGTEYRGFGNAIVQQAREADVSDFPANVMYVLIPGKPGRNPMKMLVPAEQVPANAIRSANGENANAGFAPRSNVPTDTAPAGEDHPF